MDIQSHLLIQTQTDTHAHINTCNMHAQHTLKQILVLPSLPLRLGNTVYSCEPAIQVSRVVGLTEGTTVVGLKMVSTPSVTVPSDAEISTEFRVHVVLGFTAPSKRHLKHVRTPPSTVSIPKLAEILKLYMHPVCELTVEIKGETKGILQISQSDYDSH